ncbi:WXG100 family type VII secretion target [Actinorhabdospora filicis]|nr:hypothetical protein [Actinorhabdospora filicis]
MTEPYGMESMADILPTLPADLRPAAQDLYGKATAVSPDAGETLALAFRVLREAKGDPERLDAGSDLLDGKVAAEIGRARDEIGQAAAALSPSWSGGGSEAFQAYLPRLTGAMGSMADSAARTARAVRAFRRALAELWGRIVDRTWLTGGEITAVVAQNGGHTGESIPAVLGVVDRFAEYVSGVARALLNLANGRYKAADGLGEELAGVVDGRLPVPDWNSTDRQGELRMDPVALRRTVHAFRDNGAYWDNAVRYQIEAGEGHLTPRAFGLGLAFYDDVQQVITRDRRLYRDADARMDTVAGALSEIGHLYGMIDDESTTVFSEHLDD